MSEFLKPTTPERMIKAGARRSNSPLHAILDAFLKCKVSIMEVDVEKIMAKFPGHYKTSNHVQASFVSAANTRQLPVIVKSAQHGKMVFLIKKGGPNSIIRATTK